MSMAIPVAIAMSPGLVDVMIQLGFVAYVVEMAILAAAVKCVTQLFMTHYTPQLSFGRIRRRIFEQA